MVPDFPKESLKHELGHCYQSQLLGWLYIPVIAIPSVLHNLYVRIARKLGYKPDYYSFYTEKWANNYRTYEEQINDILECYED